MSRNVLAFIAAIASMVLLPVTASAQGSAGTGGSASGSAGTGGAATAAPAAPVRGSTTTPGSTPTTPVPGFFIPVPSTSTPVIVTPPTTPKEAGWALERLKAEEKAKATPKEAREALEKMTAAEKAKAAEKAEREEAENKIRGAELPQPSEFQDFIAQSIGRVLPMYGYNLFAGVPSTFAPVDRIPVTPDYVIGPGDELLIRAWGQIDFDYRAVVDRAGAISIPKVGTFNVAGIRFQDLHSYLKTAIGRIFRNFELNVAMGELRSIQIFVVGQAQRPGSYTVSSLTTLVNALFASGGPSVKGSMRRIQLKRGNEVVTEFDFYDLLTKGDKSKDVRLLPGDVIYIPPIGNLVAVSGSVNTPAIFELKDKSTLRELIDLAGGFTTTAAGQKVTVERIVDRKFRKVDEFMLDQEGLGQRLQDGDLVTVFAISPRFDNVVTLRGNVAAPARYPWRDGMRVTDLLRDKNAVIPNTYWERQNRGELNARYNRREVNWDYAVIQRLEPSDLSTKLYAFNLGKAIQGDMQENVLLKSGDIVTIYAAEDALPQTENDVSLQGSVIATATRRFVWREGMRVRDMIPDAKWLIDYYDYWLNLKPRLTTDTDALRQGLKTGTDVLKPGQSADTDALKSTQKKETEINWDYANVVRLQPQDLTKTMIAFNLGAAVLKRNPEQNILLRPGDVVTVFSKDDIQVPLGKQSKTVRLEGEFVSSGIYRAEPGETLRQLVTRVGGLTRNAYMFGSTFTRESTRIAQQKQLTEVLDRLEREVERNAARLATSTLDTDTASTKTVVESQRALLARMRGVQPTGRIVLEIRPESGLKDIPEIALEDGDRFFVPNKPSTVSVFGAVYNESALLFKPEKSFSEYLYQTGGPTRDADTSRVFVIRADGSVVSKQGAGFFSRFEGDRLNPGDTIVVPERLDRFSWTKELKDWTQIFSQFGIGIAAIKVLKGF